MAVNLQPNPNVPPITPPPSNMPNSFPRIYIGYTESILYETKPKMRGFFFIIIMIFSIFSIPIVISGILFSSLSADYLILLFLLLAFPIIIFFVLIPILRVYFKYKNTYYAITDSRVLILQGIFSKSLISATYDMITTVEVRKPWILYKFTKLGSLTFFVPSMGYGRLVWNFVEDPDKVYKYILDIKNQITLYGSIANIYFQANVLGNVIAANVGQTKRCVHCGKQIKSMAKYCPYCGRQQP